MPRENLWKEAKGQSFHLSLIIFLFLHFLREEVRRRRGLEDLKVWSDRCYQAEGVKEVTNSWVRGTLGLYPAPGEEEG